MKRIILEAFIIATVAVALTVLFWPTAGYPGGIDELTVGEVYGPRIPLSFRQGVVAGMMVSISNFGVVCPYMSPGMMIAALDAARSDKSITDDWKIYGAVLYIMNRAGCELPDKPKPTEKPNA